MIYEYRVQQVRLTGEDDEDSTILTKVTRPGLGERHHGWEIFHLEPVHEELPLTIDPTVAPPLVRLYMKRARGGTELT